MSQKREKKKSKDVFAKIFEEMMKIKKIMRIFAASSLVKIWLAKMG
jgi:hypothetical protein